jgi:hypothetical protein
MNELVERLSQGDHPVIVNRGDQDVQDLKQRIDNGFVLIKFTGTQGGTELGVSLDKDETNLTGADFNAGTGTLHLVGNLTLNYVRVRCIADVDLATKEGKGHLDIIEEVSP